jgi:hypothetical protein
MAEYKQLKISVEPKVAEDFKTACAGVGVSMAGELTRFMRTQSGKLEKQKDMQRMGTRRQRRKATQRIIGELGVVLDNEETYMNSIPDNLQSGSAYESAQETVELLGQAIDLLAEAF